LTTDNAARGPGKPGPRRARAARATGMTVAVTVVVLGLTGCTNDSFTRLGFPNPITPQGKTILALWQGSWIAGLAVGALVWGLILWAVIFHRKRGDRLPPQARYNTPIEIMFTEFAVIVGITAVNLPFMVLTLQSIIEGIDRSVEEAAFNLGATPWQMARRVLFPLAMPGILAGTILTFILAMNAYATPVLLGGPRFQMMGPLVYGQFVQQNNWPFGGAIAFILMTATLVLTLAANLLVQQRYRSAS